MKTTNLTIYPLLRDQSCKGGKEDAQHVPNQYDFSEEPPIIIRRKSKMDPYKDIITEWLKEDKKHWWKQHHTAKRVYDRLVAEHGFTGSYDLVLKYM